MKYSRLLSGLLTVLFLILVYFAWGAFSKYRNDSSSSELALRLTQNALSSADAGELNSYAHPAWARQMPAQNMQRYIDRYVNRLGSFQGMTAITGSSDSPRLLMPGLTITASYIIDLRMENQAVSVFVDLVKERGRWWITRFRVNAPPPES